MCKRVSIHINCFSIKARGKGSTVREDKVIECDTGNPKKKEKIKKNVIASQQIAGRETTKIILSMGISVSWPQGFLIREEGGKLE